MNQGNVGRFVSDDGVWQDGALLLHFPRPQQWVGVFLAFQSQGWHTDDATGHTIDGGGTPAGGGVGGVAVGGAPGDASVRIVAALVNAVDSPEREFATLLNTTAAAIELDGWALADRDKHRQPLQGRIAPGETLRIALQPPVVLPNRGGLLTLLDPAGLKVDGVAYDGAQARNQGRTIVF